MPKKATYGDKDTHNPIIAIQYEKETEAATSMLKLTPVGHHKTDCLKWMKANKVTDKVTFARFVCTLDGGLVESYQVKEVTLGAKQQDVGRGKKQPDSGTGSADKGSPVES